MCPLQKQNTKHIGIEGFRLREQILDKLSKGEGKNWPAFPAGGETRKQEAPNSQTKCGKIGT